MPGLPRRRRRRRGSTRSLRACGRCRADPRDVALKYKMMESPLSGIETAFESVRPNLCIIGMVAHSPPTNGLEQRNVGSDPAMEPLSRRHLHVLAFGQ